MKVIYKTGNPELASVYVASMSDSSCIEFVESRQPPYDIHEKWVLIVSTLKGCPVDCKICDAGGNYKGKLSSEEILAQIEYMVSQRFPDGVIPSKKFKIQFARMGDPAFNMEVISVLKALPSKYPSANIIPSISTIAPESCDNFFEELLEVKNHLYPNGSFQMQFSLHSSDQDLKKELIPFKTWNFEKMAKYGQSFVKPGDKKITLNFATPKGYPLDPKVISKYFNPDLFIIKLTPVNPSFKSKGSGLVSMINTDQNNIENKNIVDAFSNYAYDVILSIGEVEENQIGSNCGLYLNGIRV